MTENSDLDPPTAADETVDDAYEILTRFGQDLTDLARNGMLDPVIGRESEISRAVEVLSRRNQNVPVLVAESGIESVDVLKGLAIEIVRGDVPASMYNKRLILINAVTMDREVRELDMGSEVKGALSIVAESETALLGIVDIQALAAPETQLLANLRRFVAEGAIAAIGATTPDAFRRTIESDDRMRSLVQAVSVDEPTVAHTIELLKGDRSRYEAFHQVTITDEALVAAATLANGFIDDLFLPASAVDLIDGACGLARARRVEPTPELLELGEKVSDVRSRKEHAIDAQDFEAAARLRDEEKQLIRLRSGAEEQWRSQSADLVLEIDAELVVEVATRRVGKPRSELQRLLRKPDRTVSVPGFDQDSLSLLNDAPLTATGTDLLAMSDPASKIAALLMKAPTPFTFAVDGDWGMGKSSFLRRVDQAMPKDPSVVKIHFNAWTAQSDTALEALIKSVLYRLDTNTFRRTYKRIRSRKHLLGFWRLSVLLVMRFVGGQRFVDQLWDYFGEDEGVRNELKSVINGMLSDWLAASSDGDGRRRIVVFVDDLDRCSDEVVVRVCEAIKLYLDAPGLQFVLACDMSVLARGVSDVARGDEGMGRTYLEKVVQVVFHLPAPSEAVMRALVSGYAKTAGVESLLDETTVALLIDRSSGNPRRIKRIVNSFVLEYKLDPSWGTELSGTTQLMGIVILRHLYPEFLSWAGRSTSDDPIGDFLDFAAVRRHASDPPLANVRWWATASKVFRRYGVRTVERASSSSLDVRERLEDIERVLPSEITQLAEDGSFLNFLDGLGDREERRALVLRLKRNPATALGDFAGPSSDSQQSDPEG